MKKKIVNVCYWCGKRATSKEHVPPLCLFPEEKDIGSIYQHSFRENLIRVPSCDEHNSKKSKDDEYSLVCLSSLVGNNDIALIHTYTKIKRTWEHNPKILPKEGDFIIKGKNVDFPITQVKVENRRLINSFEGIARGLYFHEYSSVFSGSCTVISKLFNSPETDQKSKLSNLVVERMIEVVNKEKKFWENEIKGSNPKVFKYQFSPKDGFDSQVVWINFYEKTDVYVAFSYEDKINKIDEKSKDFLTALRLGVYITR
jgi:hypothetical protein